MAVIQLNDPDPLYWFVVYIMVMIVSLAKFFNRPIDMFAKVTTGMVLAGLLISVTGVIEYFTAEDFGSITGRMTVEKPYIESAREFGGLFIASIYLIFYELTKNSHNKGQD